MILRFWGTGRPCADWATVADSGMDPSTAADYARLHAYVIAPGTKREMVDKLAPTLALIPGLWQLHRLMAARLPPDPVVVGQIEAIAAAVARRQPESLSRLSLTAIVDLLHDRPAEARRTLLGISPSADDDTTTALTIRAIAESALGDHAQADRLINSLIRAHVQAGKPDAEDVPAVVAEILAAQRARASPVPDLAGG